MISPWKMPFDRDAVDTPPGGYTATIVFGLSITLSIIANQIELFFFAKKNHLYETNISANVHKIIQTFP